jgi:hypothetical protein
LACGEAGEKGKDLPLPVSVFGPQVHERTLWARIPAATRQRARHGQLQRRRRPRGAKRTGVNGEIKIWCVPSETGSVAQLARPAFAARLRSLIEQTVVHGSGFDADSETDGEEAVRVPCSAEGDAVRESCGIRLLDTVLVIVEPDIGGLEFGSRNGRVGGGRLSVEG